MSVAWVGVGVAAAGALSSASAAKKGAKAQSNAAAGATEAEQAAVEQTRQDLAPWTSGGAAAQNKLATYLGTGMGTTGMVNGMQSGLTRDALREQLVGQYTRTVQPGAATPAGSSAQPYQFNGFTLNTPPESAQYWDGSDIKSNAGQPAQPASNTEVDEVGLNAAIEKYYADQTAQEAKMASDPNYGSLLKSYKDGADFKFDATDLENEAGYKFGLDQGMLGLDRAQASRGNFLSGAAVKQATRYAQDYAGTKADAAFGRQLSSFTTNKNAFDTNKNSIYNFLTGQSTLGQNSAARVGAGNQQAAQNAGSNMMAGANSAAAGSIAGSNALVSGMNGALNAYNSSTNTNSAAGWNTLLASNNIGRSGNNYNGSSWLQTAPNYENSMDRGTL